MNERDKDLKSSPLGRASSYTGHYDPGLLHPVPRRELRLSLGLQDGLLPFQGCDLWTAYEVSWLDARGKPQVAIAEFEFAATSAAIVESKSFKLYLNSLNQTRFLSLEQVVAILEQDLCAATTTPVVVRLWPLSEADNLPARGFAALSIDEESVAIDRYQPDPGLLSLVEPDVGEIVSESLYSDLLKTNCPVTGQPDWASVLVKYRGPRIDRAALLRYIVSFREYEDFHEHCVERMFVDIKRHCRPQGLTVYARYTRRGGLDINPLRSDMGDAPGRIRLLRQ